MPKSPTCVVVVDIARPWAMNDHHHRCGKPVVGERGGFPMCEEHMDLFDPEKVGEQRG